jgi:hypothetical protein
VGVDPKLKILLAGSTAKGSLEVRFGDEWEGSDIVDWQGFPISTGADPEFAR